MANGEIVSASRRITTLEMKELNERQRAEHAHNMYEHTRNSLTQVEERNLELEAKITEVGHPQHRNGRSSKLTMCRSWTHSELVDLLFFCCL